MCNQSKRSREMLPTQVPLGRYTKALVRRVSVDPEGEAAWVASVFGGSRRPTWIVKLEVGRISRSGWAGVVTTWTNLSKRHESKAFWGAPAGLGSYCGGSFGGSCKVGEGMTCGRLLGGGAEDRSRVCTSGFTDVRVGGPMNGMVGVGGPGGGYGGWAA